MMLRDHVNHMRVNTSPLPGEWTPAESREAARAMVLCYGNGRFTCQTFFTQPLVGQINWIEGLKEDAPVYFREITLIGSNLFHVRLIGNEADVRRMCQESAFYNLLRGIDSTLTEEIRSRRYLDTTTGQERWDVIAAVDRKAYHLANYVNLGNSRTRLDNVIVVGDRLLGRTARKEVVIGQLTPDVIDRDDTLLEVELLDPVNTLGKTDLLARVPNSDESFLICVRNRVYQFNLWGEMTRFEALEERVTRINSIEFNRVRAVLATNEGLFEIDIQEMPNMVKAMGLPRQIAHPQLRESFKTALYVEDPFILGIHPAMAILAKTEGEKVVCV